LHRLMRAQLGLLFTALVTSLIYPSAFVGRLRWAIAMWIVLTTARVYFTGVTLARGRLTARSAAARQIAWAPVAVALAALAVVGLALFNAFYAVPPNDLSEVVERIQTLFASGATRIV